MSRTLVTGGAGFIGSHTVDGLLNRGHEVVVLDDLSNGKRGNLTRNKNLRFVKGDIRDERLLNRLARNVDAVYHLAARQSIPESVRCPMLYHEVNATGTMRLLEACVRAGVRRLIFASSSSVYGDRNPPPMRESMPIAPISPYAASKAAAEAYCYAFNRAATLETVILRYMNVYGPRQAGGIYDAVATSFAERLTGGRPPVIFGDGEQTRDFINIKDVVAANLAALTAGRAAGQIINIGTGRPTSVNELARVFLEVSGKRLKPTHQTEREGDIRHSFASTSKASQILRFSPKISLEEGVSEFLEWYVRFRKGPSASATHRHVDVRQSKAT